MDTIKKGTIEQVFDVKGRKRGTKIWVVCPVCTGGRWARVDHTRQKCFSGMCIRCHNKFSSGRGEEHPGWKGGTYNWGYKSVKIQPEDPLYPMARKSGYVNEHRLVMAKHLGRLLATREVVHHKNGVRGDNRIENLELFTNQMKHLPSMMETAEARRLKAKIVKLNATIIALRKKDAGH